MSPTAAHCYEVPDDAALAVLRTTTFIAPSRQCCGKAGCLWIVWRATRAAARPLTFVAHIRAPSHGPNGGVADNLDEAKAANRGEAARAGETRKTGLVSSGVHGHRIAGPERVQSQPVSPPFTLE